jgi:hypothetical protein
LAWAVIEEKEVEGERVLLREAVGAEGADDSSISLSLSLSLSLSRPGPRIMEYSEYRS